jgi:signal transduction histidine kinase
MHAFASSLRVERMAETIVGSTVRIFDLISAIKDYSYMDQAPIQEIDVAQSLDTTLTMFASRLEHVTVERSYDPELPHISAYGSELNQVWTALIENALEAIAESDRPGHKHQLRISASQELDMLLVEIQDSGPGIRAELQDRIFEPFFTTKPPGQGLGLGLDNAMRIVRKHRGHMSVKSEPGNTCFRVRLPLEQLQAY